MVTCLLKYLILNNHSEIKEESIQILECYKNKNNNDLGEPIILYNWTRSKKRLVLPKTYLADIISKKINLRESPKIFAVDLNRGLLHLLCYRNIKVINLPE
jgi:hypothetical protein